MCRAPTQIRIRLQLAACAAGGDAIDLAHTGTTALDRGDAKEKLQLSSHWAVENSVGS